MCSGAAIAMAVVLFSRDPVLNLEGLSPLRDWTCGEGEGVMRTTSAKDEGVGTGLSLLPWPLFPWRREDLEAAAEPSVGKASSSLTAKVDGVAVRDW
jgi:hypothetical protein